MMVATLEPPVGISEQHTKGWRFARALRQAPKWVLIFLVRAYQTVISPMSGPSCRFYPSCSEYAIRALRRHGIFRGGWYAVWRILRCNPWNFGGVDDVPGEEHHL